MGRPGVTLKGLAEMQRKILNIARRFPKQVGKALYDELDKVEKPESMARTPVRYGDLRDSHTTRGPVIRMNKISAWIEVGEGLDYAVRVHEDLEAFHPVGQAKFLESTMNESAPYILRRVAARIKLGQE